MGGKLSSPYLRVLCFGVDLPDWGLLEETSRSTLHIHLVEDSSDKEGKVYMDCVNRTALLDQ